MKAENMGKAAPAAAKVAASGQALPEADLIAAHLAAGELGKAKAIAAGISADLMSFARNHAAMIGAFSEAGHGGALAEVLVADGSVAFQRIAWAHQTGELARANGKLDAFRKKVAIILRKPPVIRFPEFQFLGTVFGVPKFQESRQAGNAPVYSPEILEELTKLKYADIPEPSNVGNLIGNARKLGARLDVDRKSIDYLYQNSRLSPPMPRAKWEAEVMTSRALRHVIFDADIKNQELDVLIDTQARRDAARLVDRTRGTLFLVCHAGFPDLRWTFIRNDFPGSIFMTGREKGENRIPIGDARSALFTGLKTLMQKKAVVLAMDGQHGAHDEEMDVLGRKSPVGNGAAFMAYESGCAVVWYVMQRRGDVFVPHVVPGPVRIKSEKFPEYRNRLVVFYEKMMNDLCGTDPQNIVLSQRWVRLFAGYPTPA